MHFCMLRGKDILLLFMDLKINQDILDDSEATSPQLSLEHLKSISGPEIIKLFFRHNSAEHEILNAPKYKTIQKFGFFRFK